MKRYKLKDYLLDNDIKDYTILEQNDIDKRYLLRHEVCGSEYHITPHNFIVRGQRCSTCRGGVAYTDEVFKSKVHELVGNEYIFLEKYQGSQTKIKVKHNVCGNIYQVRPVNFISTGPGLNNRCPICYGNRKKTQEQFEKEVYEAVKSEYTVLGKYNGNKSKIKMRHEECGFEYEVRPRDFLKKSGNRCPRCKSSIGEIKIRNYLIKNNIPFIHGFKFEDCRNILPLEFDFLIGDPSKGFFLIEYDGRLHFEVWNEGHEHELHLQRQQENDEIKNKYCNKKGIALFRINYKQNLNKELEKIFNLNDYRKHFKVNE